jgi:XTP/dITP diphosphohydrolase
MGERITILVATRNRHKVEEIRSILGSEHRVWSTNDVSNPPALVEDAATFEGNARTKAEQLSRYLASAPTALRSWSWTAELGVLADDSGLEVDALGGAPGVHSARFASLDLGDSGNASDARNNDKLSGLLLGVPAERRTARFRCFLALVRLKRVGKGSIECSKPMVFEGTCEGRIGFEAKGDEGFGYDPWFYPEGYEMSFAELGADIKNRLSHRCKALTALKAALAGRPGG